MLLDYVRSVYSYNYWANDRIVRTIEGISETQFNVDMRNGIGTMRMTLVHGVNHGTQHRSEIAMKLTELNQSPGELGMSVFFNLPAT